VCEFFVITPETVGAAACTENASVEDSSSPLRGVSVPPPGGVERKAPALRSPDVASHPAHRSTSLPARNDLLLDAALAVAVFAASVGLLAARGADGGNVDALAVLLAALASLPLVARRVAPLGVFVLTAAASTALYAIAEPAGPPIGPTLALYWLAASGEESRTRSRRDLAIVVVLLAAHITAGGLARDAFPGVEMLFGVLLWGGTWLAGDRTRLRRERMAELEERALRAEREAERDRRLAAAEERGRIAPDLHDSAGHAINTILVHAGLGRLQTERDPDSAREAFRTIEDLARETVGEIDQMVRILREDASPSDGTGEVEPPAGLAALDGLVERHLAAGLRVTTTIRGDPHPLPPGVDRGAYRILQEALTNAARHGDGSVHVEFAFGHDALEITVANRPSPGRAARATGGGHGLIGMRERAALLGGTLDASARDGRFELHARLPCDGA
jgi:signal transduction histidine kinase